ncbi:MarR family winged helix-turn-helix transcriptional regulator [Streptomyces sp. NPDC059095]|uniref:MarR family winged helix-turn-helix transcriptional regulator n=1 Tax=unclassified Streptomyces TaxID=2593676 RepID=UPI001DADCF94|nr:MarR family transcriptional regulator [Streptomyces sp. MAG02]
MRPGSTSPSQKAADTAAEVSGLLGVLFGRAQAKAPAGPVSASQTRALVAIERLEGGNLRALGQALGSSAPATSRLCDRLEAAGLIERRLSTASRRELELYLSRQGRALLDEVRRREMHELQPVLGAMAPEALEHLAKGLIAFREAAAGAVDGATEDVRRTAPRDPVDEPRLRIARPA